MIIGGKYFMDSVPFPCMDMSALDTIKHPSWTAHCLLGQYMSAETCEKCIANIGNSVFIGMNEDTMTRADRRRLSQALAEIGIGFDEERNGG